MQGPVRFLGVRRGAIGNYMLPGDYSACVNQPLPITLA
jgi:hypothetical protein